MAEREEVVADDVQAPEPERSVRDELVASLAEVNARHEQEVEPPAGEAPANGKARDANGRFASGAGNESRTTPIEPKNTGTQQPVAGSPPPAASTPAAVEPPQGWTAQEKAVWAIVPPAAQAAIARREQDFHRRLTEHDEVRNIGNQFMGIANEHAQLIQARGSTPVALFKEFLGILNRIQTGDAGSRAQLFRQLAAQNGVSLDQPQPPGQAPSPQPSQFQLPPPVLQTVQEWNQFKARQEQEAREREAQETQQTTTEIENFRSAVDAQGQSLHPHFNTVTTLMASILRGNAATTLEEAYQLAVKAHPETSKALAEAAAAQAKVQEDARRKAEAARRKAGSIRSGPGGTPEVAGSKGSVRDDLRAAMESVRGRI